MYTQSFDPIAHSIGASAVFSLLPLLALFVMLGVLRIAPSRVLASPPQCARPA
jgi:lactate permease